MVSPSMVIAVLKFHTVCVYCVRLLGLVCVLIVFCKQTADKQNVNKLILHVDCRLETKQINVFCLSL